MCITGVLRVQIVQDLTPDVVRRGSDVGVPRRVTVIEELVPGPAVGEWRMNMPVKRRM